MRNYKFLKGTFNESDLEEAVVELFQCEGYENIAGDSIQRNFKDILLLDDLRKFILNRYADENLSEIELQKIRFMLEIVRLFFLLMRVLICNEMTFQKLRCTSITLILTIQIKIFLKL